MNYKSRYINILGIDITPIRIETILKQVKKWVRYQQHHSICLCPNYSISLSRKHPAFRQALNQATIVVADGKAVVWACKILGYRHAQQVRGADLTRLVCQMSAQHGFSNFFYGATQPVLKTLVSKLQQQYPNLKIAGTYAPPFRPLTAREHREVSKIINASRPDIVWVGLGAPKQELWMAQHAQDLHAPVLIGVGAAFDFVSGAKAEAPRWAQKMALEWLFRLMQEPRRLWKRNVYHPIFMAQVMLQRFRRTTRRNMTPGP